MSVIFILLPLALLIATMAVISFIWATKGGQLDDLDTPSVRMLFDDESKTTEKKVTSKTTDHDC